MTWSRLHRMWTSVRRRILTVKKSLENACRLACTAKTLERLLQAQRAVAVTRFAQQFLHRCARRVGGDLAVAHEQSRACVDHLPRHDRLIIADRSDDER